jgi:hypothetical protein
MISWFIIYRGYGMSTERSNSAVELFAIPPLHHSGWCLIHKSAYQKLREQCVCIQGLQGCCSGSLGGSSLCLFILSLTVSTILEAGMPVWHSTAGHSDCELGMSCSCCVPKWEKAQGFSLHVSVASSLLFVPCLVFMCEHLWAQNQVQPRPAEKLEYTAFWKILERVCAL